VWKERSIENADRIVTFGYPGLLASPTLLARTDAWLAGSAVAPALRRLVLELRDDTARGLRAQACDAGMTA
jgi:aminopeptidase N